MANPPKFDKKEALNEAMMLFWEKGFLSASTRDIQQRLDMRPASVYAAFGSKSNLYKLALEAYEAEVAQDLHARMQQNDTILGGFTAFFRGVIGMEETSNPTPLCMLSMSIHELSNNEELRACTKALLDKLNVVYGQYVEKALKAGEIYQPEGMQTDLVTYLQTQLMGLRTYAAVERDPTKLEAAIADIFDRIAVKGLKA
ncbi:TetR/AcrR family transcriptional regulator [Pseudovibrio exalbescens]|uniref:TetR/AcrR family transcriptional regulator n=1 Tax=Pseudovibrio exalbescens TaxID=197461 RepID=UPI0023659183|nr:TetR/AcrR family transcriptional regulator [Pseudovibrio exalbescens]MDD7910849.1 TetR/AcrR family transcriptional regulator [Pseudovibrio exalbescens]